MFSIFSKKITKYLLKIIKEVDIISKNKVFLYIFLSVTLLCVFLVGIFFGKLASPVPVYTLSEYDGRLAVFKEGDTSPITVLDTDLNSLPEGDRNKLKNGISVYSEDELHSLIEDFSG